MSDYLPYDVEAEIMSRLPVKSLLQFRSVSKAWKSLIDHSNFTVRYRGQQHHLGEEFREVNLPDCLAHKSICNLSMSKLRESVLVLERGVEDNNPVIYVWMMQDDIPETFTKLFSVNSNTPDALLVYVRGFRKTGGPIIEIVKKVFGTGELAVYEPYSKVKTHP